MRIFLPCTSSGLFADALPTSGHGVTPALLKMDPDEDREVLDMVAFYAAADESALLLTSEDAPYRIVVAVDAEGTPCGGETLATAVTLPQLSWDRVAAIHIDEPGFEDIIRRVIGGELEAFVESTGIEMYWFDSSELSLIREAFSEGRYPAVN